MTRHGRIRIATIVGLVLGCVTISLRSEERVGNETARVRSHPAYINYVFQPYRARLRLDDGTERIAERKPAEFSKRPARAIHRLDDRTLIGAIVAPNEDRG